MNAVDSPDETSNPEIKSRLDFLLSPWAILTSVAVGSYLGMEERELSFAMGAYGSLYLNLLKMCVLPILLSAITISLGRLINAKGAQDHFKKMSAIFIVGLLLSSMGGIASGIFGEPGRNLDAATRSTLGHKINQDTTHAPGMEISLREPFIDNTTEISLASFFDDIIPSNIFSALSQDRNPQVLVFSLLVAIALGRLKNKKTAEALFLVLDAVYQAFENLIKWLMYLLPFGLTALLADQIANVGMEVVAAMMKFVAVAVVCFLTIVAVNSILIWRLSHLPFRKVLSALREPVLIAFFTRSSLASIPAALHAMHQSLKRDKQTTDLVVPLGITICRYGNVAYFALATLFVSQLLHDGGVAEGSYLDTLGVAGILIILFNSVLAGMATAGATGVLTLSMLGIVLSPLGLPLEAVLPLFIAIDPILDPFRTLVNVHTNCTAAMFIAPPAKGDQPIESTDSIMDRHVEDILDKIGIDDMPEAIKEAYNRKKKIRKSVCHDS